jgi:hypothetical protein
MHRPLACDVFGTGVSELDEINVAEEALARAEERWEYCQVQLINKSGAKVLLNGGDAASYTNVCPSRGRSRSLDGGVDSIVVGLWKSCTGALIARLKTGRDAQRST